MQILFDDEIFFRQKFGGVSRIFTELIHRIMAHDKHELVFNCGYSENEYLLRIFPHINSFLKGVDFPLKGKIIRTLYGSYSHWRTNKLLVQNHADVFHPTFYANYYLRSLQQSKAKLIFTVHDLIHEQSINNSHYTYIAELKKQNIKKASQIIVVSESTKNDLLHFYPFVEEAKINIIPLAQSLTDLSSTPFELPENYILFIGERTGYKNFHNVLKAYSEVRKLHEQIYLVCAGSRGFNKQENDLMNSLGIQASVIHRQLTDGQLKFAYEKSLLFVFPSLYEGFGIPVLEAFASKSPAILSNRSSLPEVGGDAAIYINPEDVGNIIKVMREVIEDDQLRKKLINDGLERVKLFSWEKHAAATFKVYEKALS